MNRIITISSFGWFVIVLGFILFFQFCCSLDASCIVMVSHFIGMLTTIYIWESY